MSAGTHKAQCSGLTDAYGATAGEDDMLRVLELGAPRGKVCVERGLVDGQVERALPERARAEDERGKREGLAASEADGTTRRLAGALDGDDGVNLHRALARRVELVWQPRVFSVIIETGA
jgi:hypothetical protein